MVNAKNNFLYSLLSLSAVAFITIDTIFWRIFRYFSLIISLSMNTFSLLMIRRYFNVLSFMLGIQFKSFIDC